MKPSILIQNVTIVDKTSSYNGQQLNIFVENGIIKSLGQDQPKSDVIIEGVDLKVSTGWMDMRVSLCDPGMEHKEDINSGLNAAANGGFTAVACLPDTKPLIQTKDTISYILNSAKNHITDVTPYAAVTHDLKGEELTEMMELFHAGAVAFTDGIEPIWHAGLMTRALQYVQPFGCLIIQHAEEKKLTQYGQINEGVVSTYLGLKGMPALAEELMISRDLDLLQYAGGRIHFSCISSKNSVELIRKAKKAGMQVTCDVAIPNLAFDEEILADFDTNFKLNPPIRTKEDQKSLWKGIEDGTIDAIVTDHRPQDEESKHLEFDQADFGMIGLETAYAALLKSKPAKISMERIIECLTVSPRAILKIDQPKLAVNEPANLTVFNEDEWIYASKNKASKSKNSPFLDKKLKGKIVAVINKGLIIKN